MYQESTSIRRVYTQVCYLSPPSGKLITPRQGVDNVRVVGERRYRESCLITLGEIYLFRMVPKPSTGYCALFLGSDCSIELHDIFKRSEGCWLVLIVVVNDTREYGKHNIAHKESSKEQQPGGWERPSRRHEILWVIIASHLARMQMHYMCIIQSSTMKKEERIHCVL